MKNIWILLLLLLAVFLVGCDPTDNKIHGYVEGEFVRISPTSQGLLETLSVERGQTVKAGDALFSIDLTDLIAQKKSSQAEISRLKTEFITAQKDYDRFLLLIKTGATSATSLESAESTRNSIQANLEIASQSLAQIEKKLHDAAPTAPKSGIVQDTYYEVGDYINQGQAVVSLLPAENIKIRFFVAQEVAPKLQLNQSISVSCDGCQAPMEAVISYIAPNSEYTPPVIYSVESRDKLVFLIEAKPSEYHESLRPGLPVSIELGDQ